MLTPYPDIYDRIPMASTISMWWVHVNIISLHHMRYSLQQSAASSQYEQCRLLPSLYFIFLFLKKLALSLIMSIVSFINVSMVLKIAQARWDVPSRTDTAQLDTSLSLSTYLVFLKMSFNSLFAGSQHLNKGFILSFIVGASPCFTAHVVYSSEPKKQ